MAKEDLSKRGKVGETYRSGSFKKAKKRGLKTANLSAAQLKRAQTARGKKVSQKAVKRATRGEATSISDTQFEKGKGVTKNGKLFTGTVKLASGKTATYVRGRRVVAGAKKATGGRGGTRTTTTTSSKAASIPTTRPSAAQTGAGAGGRTGSGPSAQQIAAQARQRRNRNQRSTSATTGGTASRVTLNPNPGRWDGQLKVQRVPAKNYTSQPKNPNIGDTWTQKYPNGRTIKRKYTAGGWRVTK